MKIHTRIASIRKSKKISQVEIAFCLDMSQSLYSKLERGCMPLRIDHLQAIAVILDHPVEDFFSENEHHSNKAVTGSDLLQLENKKLREEITHLRFQNIELTRLIPRRNKMLNS